MDYTIGVVYALCAAGTAALVGIFAKLGMKGVHPVLATALRSIVMMLVCVVVAVALRTHEQARHLTRSAVGMILLSGLAGAASWIFGFLAYDKIGVSKTSPLDKLSVPLAVCLAVLFLGERPSRVNWMGIGLITVGAYLSSLKSS
jgi:transporter family protein